jgi:hypothetical protein
MLKHINNSREISVNGLLQMHTFYNYNHAFSYQTAQMYMDSKPTGGESIVTIGSINLIIIPSFLIQL